MDVVRILHFLSSRAGRAMLFGLSALHAHGAVKGNTVLRVH